MGNECADSSGRACYRVPLDIPYTADDSGGPAIQIVDTDPDAGITVVVVQAGQNTISIFDEDGMRIGGQELVAMDVESVSLVLDTRSGEGIPVGTPLAFSTESNSDIVVVLRNHETTLGDSALGLTLPAGAERIGINSFSFSDVAEGSYAVDVRVGLMTWALPLVVTNHAEAVSLVSAPDGVVPGSGAYVCFAAAAQGRTILGLSWAFLVDGVAHYGDRCVWVTALDDRPPLGSLTVMATAGGVTSPTATVSTTTP